MAHGGRVPRTRQAMATAEAQGMRSAERQLAPEARKVARKQRKQAARAAKRQSGAAVGRKECGSCQKPGCEELIRCLSAEWEGWRLVCGSCWKRVSGGVPDGDSAHPGYRYGGLWRFRKLQQQQQPSQSTNGFNL